MSSWRATLRIARRDALRARGRSALVLAMIALPVLGISAVDVVARTYELSTADKAARNLGRADAALSSTGYRAITQDAGHGYTEVGDAASVPPTGAGAGSAAGLAAGLPAGTRTLVDRKTGLAVAARDRTVQAVVRELPYADPLAAGIYRQRAGRAPAGPAEVALTSGLADRLHVGTGNTVTLPSSRTSLRVVGIVDSRSYRDERTALVAPAVVPPGSDTIDRLLVDVPGSLTLAQVQALNARGVLAEPAAPVPGLPSPPRVDNGRAQTVTALGLVVGMALLEVVLLAGPAFAVGAKRQRHQLALLSATGAESRDVRRTVLGGGLVLGAAGGVAGVAGGLALAALSPLLLRRLDSSVPGPFDARPLELLAIALLGVGTALLAALLPARTAARQDVVAALTGRRGAASGSRLAPALGLLAAVAGAGIAVAGAGGGRVTLILLGSVVAELGLVATTPALVGLAGRLAPWLPLAPRLALRDASRNRSRTAPAVAAVLAAVAGSVAVGTFVASLDAHDRAQYTPAAVPGSVVVSLPPGPEAAGMQRAEQALRRGLPARDVVAVRELTAGRDQPGGYVDAPFPPEHSCPAGTAGADPRCAPTRSYGGYFSGPLVGGAAVLRALGGPDSPAARAALDSGRSVAPKEQIFPDGRLHLVLHPDGDVDGTRGRSVTLPATALPASARPAIVISPLAAARIGAGSRPQGLAVATTRTPTTGEEDRTRGALEQAGFADATVYVERGYVSNYGVGLLALLGGSALLVLGASGIATGLAAADGRPDLATLAAVGASPTVRRVLAAAQSYVTAGLGTALGLVAGLVPAVGILREYGADREGSFPVVLPWTNLAVTVLAVPLVAAVAAAAVTRSRLPLTRRAG